MANLYDKAGLVNIPVGYQDGFLYNIKPEDNTLAFRFNRDSAATRVNKEGLIEQVGYFGPELVQNGNFSELGSELITNGTFDNNIDNWAAKSSVISWSNGKLSCDNSSGNSVAGPYQANVWLDTKIYKVTVTMQLLSGDANGNIRVLSSSATGSSQSTLINGNELTIGGNAVTQTFYLTPASSDVSIQFACNSSNAVFTIDNVSVKEVGQNWTFGTGWSMGDGLAKASASFDNLSQAGYSFVTGKVYKVTYEVKDYVNGNIKFQLTGGATLDGVTRNSDGVYTEYVNATANHITFRFRGTNFTGSIDNVSVVEVLGDKPRIDYTDSLTSPSFLLEPQSTNRLTYSEDFTQSIWTNARSSGATNQIIAPDGTTTGYKLIDSTDNNTHLLYSIQTVTTSSVFAFSMFLKKGSLNNAFISFDSSIDQSVVFDLQNGTIVSTGSDVTSSKIESFDNDWYRCSFTHTPTNTVRLYRVGTYNDNISYAGSGSDFVYCWGAQLEQQSFATSYIPTAGSTVTRAQETCNSAGNASTFNSTEGVLYCDIAALADDLTFRSIAISDGTTDNRVMLRYRTNSNQINLFIRANGINIVNSTKTLTDITNFSKFALKYKSGDIALWIDGVEAKTNTNTFTLIGLNTLSFDAGQGSDNFYGKTKGVYVFNEALTDDELQQLTGPEYNSFAALAAAYNYTVI